MAKNSVQFSMYNILFLRVKMIFKRAFVIFYWCLYLENAYNTTVKHWGNIRDANLKHKMCIENRFYNNNPSRMWNSIKALTDYKTTNLLSSDNTKPTSWSTSSHALTPESDRLCQVRTILKIKMAKKKTKLAMQQALMGFLAGYRTHVPTSLQDMSTNVFNL